MKTQMKRLQVVRSSSPLRSTAVAAFALGAMLALAGCGAGSGADVRNNPNTTPPTVSNYNGPAPQTEDVQRFKLNVWDNLVPNNRCGNCHNETQSPRFVRSDDINLAYNEANTVVNLSDPATSQMVVKVRGGHNCWLTNNDACGDILQSYIEAWANGTVGGPGKQIQLIAPPLKDPGASKNFPDDSALFANTVHPLLTQFCSNCHRDTSPTPQPPFFAAIDADAAYEAAKAKINLDNPADSRFVIRLRDEFHNCWQISGVVNCAGSAAAMQAAIQQLSDGIAPTTIDPELVVSKALNLTDGIVASSGGRHEENLIALWEFKTGSGNTAFDTSGVEPSINLTLSGNYSWVGGWGVQFTAGKAQGSTAASRKLRDLILATGEYSVEAWVAPANVVQDGPARIIAYSGGTDEHNFLLGQTEYNYDFLARSSTTDEEGEPRLSTNPDDEDLQATLQHVVVTYDPTNGRRIYVNGEFTDDVDTVAGGTLTDWDDTYAFALASEVNNMNRFAGTIRLVAIHNRALTPQQIRENFDVGVGEKFLLLFNVSDHVGIPNAYVVFEVSQFDSYSYLFAKPFFVVLGGAMPGTIPIQGIRIGINGREAHVGQTYTNLDVTINDTEYAIEGRQTMSRLGAVVALEKGPTEDEFFLTFERLGNATHVVTEPTPLTPAPPTGGDRPSELGIRDFAEINGTMSKLTGVPVSDAGVKQTYDEVRQAMPVSTGLEGFLSSQQMGITQLAISYCSALIESPSLRTSFFPGFDFNAAPASAFSNRVLVTDPLYDRMVLQGVATQPDKAFVAGELNNLISGLIASCTTGCNTSDRTQRVMKASCAAVLGSAAMLVQ
jgi:hypothetical protein